MNCLLLLLALAAPRAAFVAVVLFTDWIGSALGSGLVLPIVGFLFLPLTTIAFAFAQAHGGVEGLRLALVVLALLMDLGILGGSSRRERKRRRKERRE